MTDTIGVRWWRHSRKGLVHGEEVPCDDPVWMRVRLAEDHNFHYMSAANRGLIDRAGSVVTLRRSFMTECTPGDRP